jgi:hypothetical protein
VTGVTESSFFDLLTVTCPPPFVGANYHSHAKRGNPFVMESPGKTKRPQDQNLLWPCLTDQANLPAAGCDVRKL